MVKVAVVGLGGMGGTHFYAYVEAPESAGVEVVAACDVRPEILEKKIGDRNIRRYTDFDQMLKNEKVDIIDICTPSYLHADMAVKALNAGFNVLCEKPMALDTESAQMVKDAAEKSGKLFMVAHVVRFMDNYKYLKNIIESEKYGKLLRLDMKRISAVPTWSWEDWMLDEKKSGLTPFDLSIHDVDFMQYLFGDPKDIQCVHYRMKDRSDYVIANHIYDGFTVSTEATWYNQDMPFSATYSAVFEHGCVNLTADGIVENGQLVKTEQISDTIEADINISAADGYRTEIYYFADCVRRGEAPEKVTIDSSLNSVALVEKMEKCCKMI